MSKSVQIHIPQPCHENWQHMTPKEQGRFCGSCQKTVVDFSSMSDKELLNYFTKAGGQSTCGRFANDQLNRKIQPATNKKRFSLTYVWNLLVATVLIFESCNDTTTGEPKVLEKPVVQKVEEKVEEDVVLGKVAVDEDTARPIPPVEIKGELMEESFPINEMYVMGFTVTRKDSLQGANGLPLWLKQNCFDKEKE
jgi:hypothetical protein